MLPALVEGLCLVHAIPVAPEVAAIPEVSILVAKVATVPTSLMKLLEESEGIIKFFNGVFHQAPWFQRPTWPGCPLLPPRFIWAPPPLFMFPLCTGPPLFMGPPLCPMLPLMGLPLGEPPMLGRWPLPRPKFPRLGKPPLNAGGGKKPRGGRAKPPRGPGPAGRNTSYLNISNKLTQTKL